MEEKVFSKDELINKLKEIALMGWIESRRFGNCGSVGNTLEDLLGIEENNLPIPNASEWELKTQRIDTTSLVTLFHFEPSPRVVKFVPNVLLPKYGWDHKEKGKTRSVNEKSFRQTIHGQSRSDRGFKVVIDRTQRKVLISFDPRSVDLKHKQWLDEVKKAVGLHELEIQPYWGFDDLEHKAGTKLLNSFFVQAEVKREHKIEYYRYIKVKMLMKFDFLNFLKALECADVLIDFDASTSHNHGTKFRIRQNALPSLYSTVIDII